MRLISLLTITFAINVVAMEPEKTRKFAAKRAAQQSLRSNNQQEIISSSESSCDETLYGEASEYSYEDTNPLAYIFEQKTFSLADFNNKSGSVLPLYTGPNKKAYVILTREARGKDKGKYDDFSGGREEEDKHPIISAAREFNEEAILKRTLDWDLNKTIQFLKSKNTIVIAYEKDKNPKNAKSRDVKNVTYLVNFDQYSDKLFNNFYSALAAEKKFYKQHHTPRRERPTIEKDRIAGVLFNDLKEAVINSKDQKNVYVQANVLNPKTNHFEKEKITLRPFLVVKLRSYFLELQYQPGEEKNIRYYRDRR